MPSVFVLRAGAPGRLTQIVIVQDNGATVTISLHRAPGGFPMFVLIMNSFCIFAIAIKKTRMLLLNITNSHKTRMLLLNTTNSHKVAIQVGQPRVVRYFECRMLGQIWFRLLGIAFLLAGGEPTHRKASLFVAR
jgi:hypothetical protein